MLDDLTHDEWLDWLNCFRQDPWDEKRKDDRSAVNAIWSLRQILADDFEMPGFDGPDYTTKEDDTGESWKRLQAAKAKFLSGQLNRKTGDTPNG